MVISFHEVETGSAHIDLPVTVEGLTVTVGAGEFHCYGVDKLLVESQECVVSSNVDQVTYIQGWLVENLEGQVAVVYDELLADGIDRPLNYKEQGFGKLALLFDGRVEAGASVFSKLVVHRYHIIMDVLSENESSEGS